jgi:hypothetical protein
VATYSLGAEHARLANKLLAALQEEEHSATEHQIAIELLTVSHAMRMGDQAAATYVAESMHKHVRQLIEQSFRYLATRE